MYVNVMRQDKLTQSFCHFITFHMHKCMNSWQYNSYIAYYCKQLDYVPLLYMG